MDSVRKYYINSIDEFLKEMDISYDSTLPTAENANFMSFRKPIFSKTMSKDQTEICYEEYKPAYIVTPNKKIFIWERIC